jgi:hypothetical protein
MIGDDDNNTKKKYLNMDAKICETAGGKWAYWCKERYNNQYFQKYSAIRDVVYPWNNKNWDYTQFVRNNYDPEKLGLTRDTSISGLIKNIEVLVKQMESLISEPNPDENSKASVTDTPLSSNINLGVVKSIRDEIENLKADAEKNGEQIEKLYEFLLVNFAKNHKITAKEYGLASTLTQEKPYDDPFFDRKLDGKNSSSYFIQSGFCKTPHTTETECINNKHKWMNDTCYKNKYLYIDNSPGLKIGKVKGLNGLVPSTINTLSQLTPDNFMGILNGYSVPGLEIQNCENFTNRGSNITIMLGFILFIIVMIMFYHK